jgi:hypothetical protein
VVALAPVVTAIRTFPEGIDRSGVADALTVNTPFDGRAVVAVDGFEFVTNVLRRNFGSVVRSGPTVVA